MTKVRLTLKGEVQAKKKPRWRRGDRIDQGKRPRALIAG